MDISYQFSGMTQCRQRLLFQPPRDKWRHPDWMHLTLHCPENNIIKGETVGPMNNVPFHRTRTYLTHIRACPTKLKLFQSVLFSELLRLESCTTTRVSVTSASDHSCSSFSPLITTVQNQLYCIPVHSATAPVSLETFTLSWTELFLACTHSKQKAVYCVFSRHAATVASSRSYFNLWPPRFCFSPYNRL